MSHSPDQVLVLGARGHFGRAAVTAFAGAGWRVRAQARREGSWPEGVREVLCGADDTQALRQAGRGVAVVVHALNPSRYGAAAWRREARPMLDQAIAVARENGALLMLPGNVYNFGSQLPARLDEDTPQQADTPLGQVRVALEQALADAPGLDSVVLRAGDFFGGGRGGWFDEVIAARITHGKLRYPGPPDLPHAWMYLPDLAATFVAVAARRAELSGARRYCVPGHAITGEELAAALARVTGHTLVLDGMPWAAIRLMTPFSPMMRSLWQMRYLWQRPHQLDGSRLTAWLGAVPHTDLDVALAHALREMARPR